MQKNYFFYVILGGILLLIITTIRLAPTFNAILSDRILLLVVIIFCAGLGLFFGLLYYTLRYLSLNRTLKQLNQELNDTARILVRRDLELNQANDRLHELDSMKSEFVTIA